MNIGEILKDLRKSNNWTQTQLAKYLNIGQATIAGYENGTREPRINILILYANLFECSLDYLVGREDDFGNILTPLQNQFSTAGLTSEGKELLTIFNSLDTEYQSQLLEYARYWSSRQETKLKSNTVGKYKI